ncbi:hypothetical protein B566_EDAN013210 [Ephemera danica]|nr:hypothetical protein B566_EDAN013210 [Ephemera danica]
MVVRVLHCLSLLTMSLVTSTSKSSMTLRSLSKPLSSIPLMVVRFLAKRLALMAAIFSTDMASDRDLANYLSSHLMLSTVTEASLGASNLAANCSFTFCTCICSNLGFLLAGSNVSSAVLFTWDQ